MENGLNHLSLHKNESHPSRRRPAMQVVELLV
jgi:hypothetical protein